MVRRLMSPPAGPPFLDTFLERDDGQFKQEPFSSRIGRWGTWVTLENALPALRRDASLAGDEASIRALGLGDCAYGARTFRLEPFTVPFEGGATPTAREVLEALQVRDFGSEHLRSLDTSRLPWLGYHAYTRNDEIHTDPLNQALFTRTDHEQHYPGETIDERGRRSLEAHQALQKLVEGPLYYVLLHEGGGQECLLVVLLAVGKSRAARRLVGVVTQQVCHNLCD
jgi:hypothetical protein